MPRVFKRYGKSLGAVEFRRVTEPREWEHNGVHRRTRIQSAGNSHRKLIIGVGIEVSM
jgi:hypothetical protein